MRTRRIGLALVIVAVVALSACSHSGGEKSSGAASATTSPAADAKGALARTPKGRPLTTLRQVVYTADLQVRVDDVAPASAHAISIVTSTGGYLFSQDANLDGRADETLVFKLPPAAFEPILARLGNLGTPLEKHVSAADVTDRVVDLVGRLKTANASAARLRALFAAAGNVPDIVAIENELATRESEVESLQGELAVVQNQVQLATVTLVLTTRAPSHKATTPAFATALSGGWRAFVDTGRVALAVVGATLPFLAFAGALALVVAAVRRRRRANHLLTP